MIDFGILCNNADGFYWYFLDEPTLADAIMNRMTAKSHRIELVGESRRKKNR